MEKSHCNSCRCKEHNRDVSRTLLTKERKKWILGNGDVDDMFGSPIRMQPHMHIFRKGKFDFPSRKTTGIQIEKQSKRHETTKTGWIARKNSVKEKLPNEASDSETANSRLVTLNSCHPDHLQARSNSPKVYRVLRGRYCTILLSP